MRQKTNLLLIFFCFYSISLSAQSDRIKQLETNLSNRQGVEYITDAIQLSTYYLDEGFYDQAIHTADQAASLSEEMSSNIHLAKSLRAAALGHLRKGGRKDLKKADSKLRKSQELLSGANQQGLQFQNLKSLIVVAKKRGKLKDVVKYKNQLAVMRGEKTSEEIATTDKKKGFPIFGKNKREKEAIKRKLDESENAKEELAKELEAVSTDREVLAAQKEELDFVKESLSEILEYKEKEISTMSEDKAKTELVLANQKHLVDSLNILSMRDSFALSQQQFLLKQQKLTLAENQAKIKLQESQRNLLLALASLFILVAIGMFSRYKNMKKHNEILGAKNEIIREEQHRSEELLLNILPSTIANELKQYGVAKTRLYDEVTVLFVDFIGFSKIAAQSTPENLVGDLDYCFKAFDKIIEKHGLEKIKTIGDAYMCAGGLPNPSSEHPSQVIRAALEIQHFLAGWKLERVGKGLPVFEARLGVHTGPIIAGVVGDIKFAYDIWGDTVNVASRMETSGEGGRVNISGATYDLIKDNFKCKYRGKVPAKNMGEVDMYFVNN